MTAASVDKIEAALETYEDHFRSPRTDGLTPCDLIMQGGVASGVVYPLAILEIAKKHRLHGIGGTSAGAIGAVVAAAAEYGRQNGKGGFSQFVALSEDVLKNGVARLFQPSVWMGAPFDLLVALQSRGPVAGVMAYIGTRWPFFLIAGAIGILSIGWPATGSPPLWSMTFYYDHAAPALQVLAITLVIGSIVWGLKSAANKGRDRFDIPLLLILIVGLLATAWAFFWTIIPDGRPVPTRGFWAPDNAIWTVIPRPQQKWPDDDFWVHNALAIFSELPALMSMGFVLLSIDLWRMSRLKHNFGLCSGTWDERGTRTPALMEWLHDHVQRAAGRLGGKPLTFGDLEPQRKAAAQAEARAMPFAAPVDSDDIELRMTVTDLGQRRPHTLPFLPDNLYFKPSELVKVLPEAVVRAMYAGDDPRKAHPLPPWWDLPVLFAVRMSLCYPVLFRMVPLYSKTPGSGDATFVRVLFTDGGICSNFPIHFYDGLLPRWPTLAIALDASPNPKLGRVDIDRRNTRAAPHPAPRTLGDALGRIFQTAGGWRDQVQTSLPGYKERVCVVGLSKAQGGFNFNMAQKDVASAMGLGCDAGALLCGQPVGDKEPFDEKEHRYRRFLVAYARLEETLDSLSTTWSDAKLDWTNFILGHKSPEFPQEGAKADAIREVVKLVNTLAPLFKARPWRTEYDVPEPPTNLRVTPRE